MKAFFALIGSRNKEYYRDYSTLLWGIIFPILIVIGFKFGYSDQSTALFKMGILKSTPHSHSTPHQNPVMDINHLKSPSIQWIELKPDSGPSSGHEKLRHHELDLIIELSSPPQYWVNESSQKSLLLETLLRGHSPVTNQHEWVRHPLEGAPIRYVEWLFPGLLAMNLMFSSLFGVGYTLVRYRKNGVLRRFKATPMRPLTFLSAQVFSRILVNLVTFSLLLVGSVWITGFQIKGSLISLYTFTFIGAVSMISLGLMVAARVKSEEVAEGVLNVLTWPMMFLSGVWFSIENASPVVKTFSKIFPLTHLVDGMRAIMIDQAPLHSLIPQMMMLGCSSLIFLLLGALLFKWD